MDLSDDQAYNSHLTQSKFRAILLYLLVLSLCLGFTTAAPTGEQTAQDTGANQASSDQTILKSLNADKAMLERSIFVSLSKNSQALENWEKSDGWIQFYQGQLPNALTAFEAEKTSKDPTAARSASLGYIRTLLELSISYQHLVEINQYLVPRWLAYERSRPNSQIHQKWYDIIEVLFLSGSQNGATEQKRYTQLSQALLNDPTMQNWMKTLNDESQNFPQSPKVKTTYRRWIAFATAVKEGQLKKVRKKMRKLRADGLILVSDGEANLPSLKVFDPRLPSRLAQYYAQSVLELCKSVEFGHYYCARAHEQLGQKEQAVYELTEALTQLSALEKLPNRNHIEHVLITAHTSISDFRDEIDNRLIAMRQPKKELSSHLEKLPTMTTAQQLWASLASENQQQLPALFPERRRALGILYSKALEEAQGTSKDYVASLGLNDRWLDALHYQYAKELVKRDQRVRALKVLNAAEEAKAGSRLQGRNRLPRLLLSTYNQLKMDRYRVSAKYFQRLKEKFPALSFVLVMTSDILSGKSFENNGSRANAGQ